VGAFSFYPLKNNRGAVKAVYLYMYLGPRFRLGFISEGDGSPTASSAPGVGFGFERQTPAKSCAANPGPQGNGASGLATLADCVLSVPCAFSLAGAVAKRTLPTAISASETTPSKTRNFFIAADQPSVLVIF
jgi:hypothetical protein